MPAAVHQDYPPEENFDAALWRYMDFTKFVSTLESKALFFARYDTLVILLKVRFLWRRGSATRKS